MAGGRQLRSPNFPTRLARVYVAGVVPSSVGSMKVTLADGSTTTVGVTDNAWALETEGEPQGYQSIPVGG